MYFKIEINGNGSAFDEPMVELGEILEKIQQKVQALVVYDCDYNGTLSRKILDSNGNTCGTMTLSLGDTDI